MIPCICQALLVNVSNICITEQQGQLIDAGGMQRVEQLIRWYAKSKDERSLKINHKKISVKLQGIECIMFAKIMKQTICPKKNYHDSGTLDEMNSAWWKAAKTKINIKSAGKTFPSVRMWLISQFVITHYRKYGSEVSQSSYSITMSR